MCIKSPWRLEQYKELTSTSDYCIERASKGEKPFLAILADRQTKGRGSRGRNWESGEGNLALSFLLRPDNFSAEQYHAQNYVWPFLSGLGLHMGLVQAGVSSEDIFIKWPNDIVTSKGKLAGILIEQGVIATIEGQLQLQQNQNWLVIGMGVNIANAPHVEGKPTVSLQQMGYVLQPDKLACHILHCVNDLLNDLARDGFEALKAKWLDCSVPVGYPLAVEEKGVQYKGSFAGIGKTGQLKLQTATNTLEFVTGEILWLE